MRNTVTGKWILVDPRVHRVKQLQRRIFAWADLFRLIDANLLVSYVFQGMTYKPGDGYQPKDITEYLTGVRKIVSGGIYGYAWVGEMQDRGVPQYHVLWAINPSLFLPYPDKSGLWTHGSSSVSKRGNPNVRSHYICKYISKMEDKVGFPSGFRIFGVYIREDLLDKRQKWTFTMSAYPKWLYEYMCENGFEGNYPRRVKGGGWLVDEKYNIVKASDWAIEGMPGLVRQEDVINSPTYIREKKVKKPAVEVHDLLSAYKGIDGPLVLK